jgi:hypothetical protein
VDLARTDGEYHTLTQGYAGLWGYPTFFAAAVPKGQRLDSGAERLHSYMLAKKHQVCSDRSLGLLLDDQRRIVAALYLNDPPTENPDLDALGADLGLQPTWKRGEVKLTSKTDGSRQIPYKRRYRR